VNLSKGGLTLDWEPEGKRPGSTRELSRQQHGAHGAVSMRTSYSTASDYSTAHGVVRIPGSYSTARCATAPQLLTCHSTARTAQCAPRGATTRRSAPVTITARRARRAWRMAHTGELQHDWVRIGKKPMRTQDRAQQSTKQLGRGRNTQGPGAHRARQHEHKRTRRRAIGVKCYGYLDPKGR
jgi:hypothetical protein